MHIRAVFFPDARLVVPDRLAADGASASLRRTVVTETLGEGDVAIRVQHVPYLRVAAFFERA